MVCGGGDLTRPRTFFNKINSLGRSDCGVKFNVEPPTVSSMKSMSYVVLDHDRPLRDE